MTHKSTVYFQRRFSALLLIGCFLVIQGGLTQILWGGNIDLAAQVTIQNNIVAVGEVRNLSTDLALIGPAVGSFTFLNNLGAVITTATAQFTNPTLPPGGVDTASYSPIPTNTSRVELRVNLGTADVQRGAVDPNLANNLATFEIANNEADFEAVKLVIKPPKATKDDPQTKVTATCTVKNNGPKPATPRCTFTLQIKRKVNGQVVGAGIPQPVDFGKVVSKGATVTIEKIFTLNLSQGDEILGSVNVTIVETAIQDPDNTNNTATFPKPTGKGT